MADLWLVRVDDQDGPTYLYEATPSQTVFVPWPQDAKTFTNAGAKRTIRNLGMQAKAVRRFEELRVQRTEEPRKQRFTEKGAECRNTHVKGYTGPICSCPPLACFAVERTEEPSDDEGLEPIETSPLTEREPDL